MKVGSTDQATEGDTLLAPPANVHSDIRNGETELGRAGLLFNDGKLWLDWSR